MSTSIQSDSVISDVGRRFLRWHLQERVGPVRLSALLDRFGSLDAVESASLEALQSVQGIGPKLAQSVRQGRCDVETVEREVEEAGNLGLRIVCREDPDYPASLHMMPDPPTCLYIKGRLERSDCVSIAVVGTRRCSRYGREQALRFGESLAGAGFTVVSGLARGVDSFAHQGALNAGGRTVAVLGNGLSMIYPEEHGELAAKISVSGAVISELPIRTSPDVGTFPRRNRIIAGLSLGVLVIEAGRRSGALITARLASEYNREVFAVPGRIDQPAVSTGVNGLIRDGQAKLVCGLEDILDELDEVGAIMSPGAPVESSSKVTGCPDVATGIVGDPAARETNLTDDERSIVEAIRHGAESPEEIRKSTGLVVATITPILTSLQLKGFIKRLPGDKYVAR